MILISLQSSFDGPAQFKAQIELQSSHILAGEFELKVWLGQADKQVDTYIIDVEGQVKHSQTFLDN